MLVAPTGCGKTWTAIMPFVYSLLKGETIADRLIYVLPLRSLASALYQVEKPLSPEAVLAKHSKRSLVIYNTVRRAQEISRSLNDLIVERGLKTQVLLLHSRYLPDDRKEIERRLTPLFGPPGKCAKEVDAILVSTQVVESRFCYL